MGCFCSIQQYPKLIHSQRTEVASMEKSEWTTEDVKIMDTLPYYWGEMSDEEAETRLLFHQTGMFLLRSCPMNTKSWRYDSRTYIISMKRFEDVVSLKLLNEGRLYFLGEETHHPRFQSIDKLVSYYTNLPSTPRMLQVPLLKRVCSLQELCSFVIKRSFNAQEISKLRLPNLVKEQLCT